MYFFCCIYIELRQVSIDKNYTNICELIVIVATGCDFVSRSRIF